MIATYRVLSALLSYPTAELQAAVPDLRAAIEGEGLLETRSRAEIGRLLDEFAARDLYDLQERYVLLFDRTRSLSLHLFEHVHGESRDRGQAMIDLLKQYEAHGLMLDAKELPDHLPVFLEFLATLDPAEARQQLGQPLHIVSALAQRLRKRQSSYAAVFRALEDLATRAAPAGEIDALLAEPDDDPNDLAALDRQWEDEPVTFGPTGDDRGCGRVERMLQRMGTGDSRAAGRG